MGDGKIKREYDDENENNTLPSSLKDDPDGANEGEDGQDERAAAEFTGHAPTDAKERFDAAELAVSKTDASVERVCCSKKGTEKGVTADTIGKSGNTKVDNGATEAARDLLDAATRDLYRAVQDLYDAKNQVLILDPSLRTVRPARKFAGSTCSGNRTPTPSTEGGEDDELEAVTPNWTGSLWKPRKDEDSRPGGGSGGISA